MGLRISWPRIAVTDIKVSRISVGEDGFGWITGREPGGLLFRVRNPPDTVVLLSTLAAKLKREENSLLFSVRCELLAMKRDCPNLLQFGGRVNSVPFAQKLVQLKREGWLSRVWILKLVSLQKRSLNRHYAFFCVEPRGFSQELSRTRWPGQRARFATDQARLLLLKA